MLDPLLVADVLEGVESTLEEVVRKLVACPEIRARLDIAHTQVTALRAALDKPEQN